MKTQEFKNLIKQAVKEVFHEELRDIILEVIKTQHRPLITENKIIAGGNTKTQNPSTITQKIPMSTTTARKAYLDILNETAQGPKSGLDGEFKITENMDVVNGSLPQGQLGLDAIMNLIGK